MSAAPQAPEPLAHRPATGWCGWLVLAALLSLLFAPARAADDEDEDKTPPLPKGLAEIARKYAGVAGWEGFWETSETRSFSKSNEMGYINNSYEGSGHGRFVLQRTSDGREAARGVFEWVGNGEATGMRNETMSSWSKWGPRLVGEDWRKYDGGQVVMKDVSFTIWMDRQYASVHAGRNLDGALKQKREGHAVVSLSSGDGQHHYGEKTIDETMPGSILTFFIPNYEKTQIKQWRVVQGGPGVLTFEHEERGSNATGGDSIHRSRVLLHPVYDDVELEVTVEGYTKWRPKGSIEKPLEPGNSLVARATLKSKTGKLKELPAVKLFKFELIDTSREPGVCLNWPLGSKDQDYDLRLALVAGGTLSKADQQLDVAVPRADPEGQPYAETRINSYDFGGRASLLVRCTLEDGRELLGLMKQEGGNHALVPLPLRFSGDWIAKQWREDRHVIGLAARADDENAPLGDGTRGDGLTLYEEYRGWVENGRHIEGDPQTKDFFILLQKAGIALAGVAKFQQLTGLNVHYKFTAKEFPGSRIVNANRDLGPNVTDQHGVIVRIRKGLPGVSDAVGGPGNPKMISAVLLMSDLASVSADYAAITVAHELGHCVNLWHHGDCDHKVGWVVVEGKLYEGRPDGTVTGEIFVVNEQVENLTPTVVDMALDVQAQPPPHNHFILPMGCDQGQHSGAEDCIMRYDCSRTFVYRDRPDLRFWLFDEPVGHGLCTSAEGTGVNDKDRTEKQSRYGPALAGRGDCLHQIHVTDADTSPWRYKEARQPTPRASHNP